ncbi:MAG: RloB family protein [Muribaculaceae bacterium]|nr:RloB family protein [Muribaculaceae bacterium]
MARRIKERKLKNPTITIIGEGATERFYFTHLKRLCGYDYVCKPRNFTEQTLEEMQKQIERVIADDGIAVCVFDADVTRTRQAEKIKYERMKQKYADNPSVVLCDTMPSIEFWFLLHYLNTNRYFATSDEVIAVLRVLSLISANIRASFQKKIGFQRCLLITGLRLPCAMQT